MNPVPEHRMPETITLSRELHIDFHEGVGVWWATLHSPRWATEIGTARSPNDIDDVLTMAAGVLLERPAWATRTSVSPTGERWVLIGRWILSARPGGPHVCYPNVFAAAAYFDHLVKEQSHHA